MSQMEPVEITERDDSAGKIARNGRAAVKPLHRRALAASKADGEWVRYRTSVTKL